MGKRAYNYKQDQNTLPPKKVSRKRGAPQAQDSKIWGVFDALNNATTAWLAWMGDEGRVIHVEWGMCHALNNVITTW